MTSRLRVAVALSGVGHLVHNIEEFGLTIAAAGQTLIPAVVTALLYVGARRPTRRFLGAVAIWGGVVIVLGGGSVLPWSFLPFEPAQTVSHYAAHLAYAVLQAPMLAIAYRMAHRTRHETPAHGSERRPRGEGSQDHVSGAVSRWTS